MGINPIRHLTVFSPAAFGDRRVDVIGCGSIGSRVALSLAKLGVNNIHLWDFDTVEEHNIANQAFGLEHVGILKVEALASIIKIQTGASVTTHAERVDGSQALGEVVFLLTDTMSSRKEIWSKALRFKPQTKLLVEGRMGADSGRVYAIQPYRPGHVKNWEAASAYSDEEAEVSACGASISVGPTTEIMSGLAVWQMIRWFSVVEQGNEEDLLDNEIIFSLRSMMTICRSF